MIKCVSFEFERLPSENHWIDFAGFSNHWRSNEQYFGDYHESSIRLNPDEVYQLAMDQSSSNTGIFIKNYTNTEVYMIEVARKRGELASDYIFDLEMFLHQTCEGCTLSHIIYERPIDTGSYRSAQVLFQLEGTIRALGKRYKEFSAAKLDCIENSSWRSVVIDKVAGAKFDRKTASRVSVQQLFPWTMDYGLSLYKDNDIFEAIGVMMGWFFLSFDHLGRPYVRGDKSARTVGGFCLPGLDAKTVQEKLASEGIESEFLVENPRYSIYQNITGGVEQNTLRCVEISSKYTMLCMCVECNIKWMEPEVMTLIISDASTLDTRLRAITGDYFHFVV